MPPISCRPSGNPDMFSGLEFRVERKFVTPNNVAPHAINAAANIKEINVKYIIDESF